MKKTTLFLAMLLLLQTVSCGSTEPSSDTTPPPTPLPLRPKKSTNCLKETSADAM